MPISKLQKLNPSAIGKCAMVFVLPLAIGKRRRCFVNTLCTMANAGKTVFDRFTKVQSIHRNFSK